MNTTHRDKTGSPICRCGNLDGNIIMTTANDLTAYGLGEAIRLATKGYEATLNQGSLTLIVGKERVGRAIPLVWAVLPDMGVVVNESFGPFWMVRYCRADMVEKVLVISERLILNHGC